MDILTHAFGLAGLTTTAFGLCLRTDQTLRLINLIGCLFWVTHFALLEAYAACVMLGLAIVMISSSLCGWRRLGQLALLASLATVPGGLALALMGHIGWASLSPIVGGLLINLGVSYFRGHKMSLMIAGGEAFWVLTGALFGSPAAVAGNLLNLSALSLRTLRIWKRPPASDAPIGLSSVEPQA